MLEKYKDQIEEKMHAQCSVFITIGSLVESPRWININIAFKEEGKFYLKFASTQVSYIYFSVEVSKEDYYEWRFETAPIWAAFKRFRTEFLEENYPTISLY